MSSKKSAKPAPWHTGKAVAELLTESNRAKAAAALAMGATVTTLYRWLNEEQWPLRNLQKASAYLGVTIPWLMTGAEPKYAAATGGNDPRDARAERLLMKLQGDIDRLVKVYTQELASLYKGETPPQTGRREWDTRPEDKD